MESKGFLREESVTFFDIHVEGLTCDIHATWKDQEKHLEMKGMVTLPSLDIRAVCMKPGTTIASSNVREVDAQRVSRVPSASST